VVSVCWCRRCVCVGVLVSSWQGIIIMYMASQHMIKPVLDYSGEDVAKGLQVCQKSLTARIKERYCTREVTL